MSDQPDDLNDLQQSTDRSAFNDVLLRYRDRLKRMVTMRLNPRLQGRIDASDVVQQTLMDAWKGQEGFRGTTHGERMAWLRVILTRVILRADRDLLKTEKRGEGREKTLQSAIDQTSVRIEQMAIGNERDPVSVAVRAEQTLKLAAAMEQLPDDYRRVLQLRHIDGRSHAEIAKEIGRTSAATRMLWVRALEALKKVY